MLRAIYAKYGTYIRPVLKIILAFLMLSMIQKNIGYNEMLSGPLAISAASVLCAFFPSGFITFLCVLFVIVDMFEVSLMMAGFTAFVSLMIFVLYFGFRPGYGIVIALVPLMFYLKLPFLVPLILGLSAGLYSAIPAVIGVLFWNILRYFAANQELLAEGSTTELATEIMTITKTILLDKYMFTVMFAFALCIAIVNLVCRSSLRHCWMIAVSSGTAVLAIIMIVGGAYFSESSFAGDIIGLVISYFLAVFYVAVIYSVDFNKTEHLSYEDDEYYYYVKAVPKVKATRVSDKF